MRLTRFVIPCRRLRVEVQYGEAEGLSTSEQMLLRAVAAGATSLDDLKDLLGLPPRMLLDLCIEMLHGGLLQVERPSGRLHVATVVVDAMGDPLRPPSDWAKAFASLSPSTPDDVELWQDLVSGALFRRPPRRRWEGTSQRAPVDPELPEPDQIPKSDLMFVAAAKERETGESTVNDPTGGWATVRAHRVVNVSMKRLERAGSATAGALDVGHASLLVTVRCFAPVFGADDELVEPPRFVIVEPREIPVSTRRRIADGLTRLAERGVGMGRNQFFRTLQYDEEIVDLAAERETLDPTSVMSILEAAESELVHQPATPELHSRLKEVAEATRDAIDRFSRNRGCVELLSGAAAHHAAAIRALKEAGQQVILGCPWMNRLGSDAAFDDALASAAARGVQVHLLWGVSSIENFASVFGGKARRLIELANSAGQGKGGAVFVSERPCASHAKLIICDLDWMLVGSANYLNAPPERTTGELGLLVKPIPPADSNSDQRPTACRHVADVVAWCRTLLRDFQLRRAIVDEPVLFGRQGPIGSVDIARDVAEAQWGEEISERLWETAWKSRLKELKSRLVAGRSAPCAVFDGEHRRLLFEAFARAKRRLVIASPRLGVGLLGSASLVALRAAAEREGLEIVVLHSGEAPGTPRERQRLADERPQIRELVSKGLSVRTWDSHAKLLVFDDEVVVSSFNFLSFEGYYGDRNRARHELGVRVWSPALAGQLWELILRESSISEI